MLDKEWIFRPLLSQKFTILNTFCKCWQEGASLGLAENMDRVSPFILPPTSFFRSSFFSSAPLDCKVLQMQPSLCGKGRQMPCMNFTRAKGRRLSLAPGDPCTEGLCLE